MTKHPTLRTLSDRDSYRAERASAWEKNVGYWLQGPLRHVVDVGDYIAARTEALCAASGRKPPVVVDMGFGDGWLPTALLGRKVPLQYIGLDCSTKFIDHARRAFFEIPNVSFDFADLEEPCDQSFGADVVVNAFNFFELCELTQPFKNAAGFLRTGGVLYVATIDKTYLLLALSKGWHDFLEQLRLYQMLPGTKYGFQPIDLGHAVADTLYYPSVLYSTEDYLSAAETHGFVLKHYKEHVFTGAVVPKIYCHFEFEKVQR